MRFLNKIILINSASIKYAEINLNGNVHFIGTQGVGKSTILRAILFFYNAESRKLGVPTGPTNKSFAEWYFTYLNSFIIYEIKRETGSFCVLTFKHQNRVCYRFIDGEYNKKYFINEDGIAHNNWDSIRKSLDANRLYYTKIIRSFDEYRDIIYGNSDGKKEFKKYSILESKQYKNIPRTIQNIFLNTKLEATFIKQTIINSMNENDLDINLNTYASHLSNFEININDIKELRKPSTLKLTDNISELYLSINHLGKEIFQYSNMLLWTIDNMYKIEPILKEKHSERTIKIEIQNQKLIKIKSLHNKRIDEFKKEINILENKIRESTKKKIEYNNKNIDEIISRVNEKDNLKISLKNLDKELQILTSKFTKITNKYESLISELTNQHNASVNSNSADLNDIKNSREQIKYKIINQYDKLFDNIRNQNKEKIEIARRELDSNKNLIFKLKNKVTETNHKQINIEKINIQKSKNELFTKEVLKFKHNILEQKNNIETLKYKWEIDIKSEKSLHQIHLKEKTLALEEVEKSITKTTAKIEGHESSFYGWLNNNAQKWEQNIGKICDDEILFSNNLSPKINNELKNTNSFYGIDINLKEIKRTSKSIKDYKFDLSKLNTKKENLEKEKRDFINNHDKNLEKIKKRFLPKIKTLKEKNIKSNYQLDRASTGIKEGEVYLNEIIENSKVEKENLIQELTNKIGKATDTQLSLVTNIKVIENEIENKIVSKRREKTIKINESNKIFDNNIDIINSRNSELKDKFNNRLSELKALQKRDLEDKGAETTRISKIENKKENIEKELLYIEENYIIVIEYQKDKKELFDRIKEFKNQVDFYSEKQNQQITNFKLEYNTLKSYLDELISSLNAIAKEVSDLELGFKAYKNFQNEEIYNEISKLNLSTDEIYNNKNICIELIDKLKGDIYSRISRTTELEVNIKRFLNGFSDNNIFKFRKNLSIHSEYMTFAEELFNFIEDNKIDEYEKRTNELFGSIFKTINTEISNLLSRAGDIQKIVRKINNDFVDRIFVGAVKKIELKIEDSTNKIVIQLKSIKDFYDNHGFDLGPINLFSTENQELTNKKAVNILKNLVDEIKMSKNDTISISDSFELKFRVTENNNDTGWVEKLSNVGSDGTDVLVKAMLNIMLINVFKDGVSKKFNDFKLHCMMDEIGRLHPNNVKGILKFANDRNIIVINGSPTETSPLSYKHIYKLSKDNKNVTKVVKIISNLSIV